MRTAISRVSRGSSRKTRISRSADARAHLRRHLFTPLLYLLLLAGLASCALPGSGAAATPTPDPDLATLKGFPAYTLRYPGTTLLRSGEAPRQPGLLGTCCAQVDKIYGLHAPLPAGVTPASILDWYNQRLHEQGWKVEDALRSSRFLDQNIWIRESRDHIRVGFFASTTLFREHYKRIVYSVS